MQQCPSASGERVPHQAATSKRPARDPRNGVVAAGGHSAIPAREDGRDMATGCFLAVDAIK